MNSDDTARSAGPAAPDGRRYVLPAETTGTVWIRSAALTGIFFLLVLYTMYFAASLVMPIALAFLLSLVLSPVVRLMVSCRIPQGLSALLVMLGVAASMVAAVYALAEPAAQWMDKAPQELRRLEYKLSWVKEPIKKIQQTREQVKEMTDVEGGSGDGRAEGTNSGPTFSLVDIVLARTPNVIYGVAVTLVLLFFVLASGDAFLNKMVQITPKLRDKKRVVETAREIQRHVSIYLGTITIINIVVAGIVALAMYIIGMPNPVLWGVMVGLLNYVPYLGVAVSLVIITFVSLLTFNGLVQILLPAAVIFAINVVEGQFLTPILAGRRLRLSPVAVFLSIVVLGWMWGFIGVLMAVPALATLKLVFEHVEVLGPVATFLGRD